VSAFLDAARAADLAVLAPDVVRRADPAALRPGVPAELRGARAVAEGTVLLAARAREASVVLLDGRVGAVVVAGGRLRYALRFTVSAADLITGYEVIADPVRLGGCEIGALDFPHQARDTPA
jgi:RNA polymerase sigma-70 factor (ECF subfamily)